MEISRNDILVPCIHANMLPSSQAEDSVDFNHDVSSIANETDHKDEVISDLRREVEGLAAENSSLKDVNSDLVREIEELKQREETVLLENSVLCAEKCYYEQELGKLMAMRSHLEHVIESKNRRLGEQGKQLNKFLVGVFCRSPEGDAVGYGSVLNGEEIFWVKGSQMEWDEVFHRPLFGHEEHDITNLVLLQKAPAGEGRVVVNAVGCHVLTENMLEFRLNGREVSHFDF